MNVMYLAKHWGVTPWQITGEPETMYVRSLWYRRGLLYYQQVEKAAGNA
jgi:hypothetical protein